MEAAPGVLTHHHRKHGVILQSRSLLQTWEVQLLRGDRTEVQHRRQEVAAALGVLT